MRKIKRVLTYAAAVCLLVNMIWTGMLPESAEAFFSGCAGMEAYGASRFEKDSDEAVNIVRLIEEYVEPYLGTDTLNNYDNGRAIQCHAFTNYVWRNVFGYDVYSSKCERTEASTDYESLGEYINTYARPGDMLRVDGKHSMIITEFDEDTVSGYDWLYNKKERKCTYTWEGVKAWGDGTQSYWLYQIADSVYEPFEDDDYRISKIFGPEPPGSPDAGAEDSVDADTDSDSGNTDSSEPNRGDSDRNSKNSIVMQSENPVMTVNGVYLNIDDSGTKPMIINDRLLTPVRGVVEAMGGTISWNNDLRMVEIRKGETCIQFTIDSTAMTVNGRKVEMDTAPVIINERTMLPIRYVTENLGAEMKWYDSIKAVEIIY